MDINKIRGYLNISQKAGYIIWGGDNLKDYTKKLYLVLYNPNCQKIFSLGYDSIEESHQ